MTDLIKNLSSKAVFLNGRASSLLNDSEITILGILNARLNVNLGLNEQRSFEGLKIITRELVKQHWSIYDLHELGISLRSLGVICLKLRGFYGFPYNPFGHFGINRESFINYG